MAEDVRRYRAICFDLDGTLLPMDIEEFMRAYFQRIAGFMVAHGVDGEQFMSGLKAGTKAMAVHEDDATNEEAFWREFFKVYPAKDAEEKERLLCLGDEFYDTDFSHIGDGFKADPAVACIIEKLQEKGYPLVLTTMPMFPRRAVEHRLAWAGVDPSVFERITSYENSRSVKPKQTYFAENLAALGLRGEEVLMVGNNTMEDLAFLDLGADGYLITDWLLDPIGFDLDAVAHGPMEDFEHWVEALPPCEDPAEHISEGPVERASMIAALEANAVKDLDLKDAASKAAAVADAVTAGHELHPSSRSGR